MASQYFFFGGNYNFCNLNKDLPRGSGDNFGFLNSTPSPPPPTMLSVNTVKSRDYTWEIQRD